MATSKIRCWRYALCGLVALLAGLWLAGASVQQAERDQRAIVRDSRQQAWLVQKLTRHNEDLRHYRDTWKAIAGRLEAKLDRYGSINAPVLYEPGDPAAAQPLQWNQEP